MSPFLTIADVMQRKKKLTDWLFTRKDRLIQKNHMFLYECLLTYLKILRQTSYESFELFVSHFLHLMLQLLVPFITRISLLYRWAISPRYMHNSTKIKHFNYIQSILNPNNLDSNLFRWTVKSVDFDQLIR